MDEHDGPSAYGAPQPAREDKERITALGVLQYAVGMLCAIAAKDVVSTWWDDLPLTSDTLWTAALFVVSLAVLVRIKSIREGRRGADEVARASPTAIES